MYTDQFHKNNLHIHSQNSGAGSENPYFAVLQGLLMTIYCMQLCHVIKQFQNTQTCLVNTVVLCLVFSIDLEYNWDHLQKLGN